MKWKSASAGRACRFLFFFLFINLLVDLSSIIISDFSLSFLLSIFQRWIDSRVGDYTPRAPHSLVRVSWGKNDKRIHNHKPKSNPVTKYGKEKMTFFLFFYSIFVLKTTRAFNEKEKTRNLRRDSGKLHVIIEKSLHRVIPLEISWEKGVNEACAPTTSGTSKNYRWRCALDFALSALSLWQQTLFPSMLPFIFLS